LIAGTFLRQYDYNITPDLLAALVAALGLFLLLRRRDLGGGCVFGVAVSPSSRISSCWPFAWIYVFLCRGRRGLGRSIAAAAVPLSFLLLLNQVLFGSPLITSYDRNVLPRNGELTLVSHRGQFDGELWEGLSGILLDRDHGLIPTSPALWIALPGLALMWRSHRREAALTLVLGEFYLLLFATYRYWATTRYGNRFLNSASGPCGGPDGAGFGVDGGARERLDGRRPAGKQDGGSVGIVAQFHRGPRAEHLAQEGDEIRLGAGPLQVADHRRI